MASCPRISRAREADISSCPTCTPSAPIFLASITSSLMRRGTPYLRQSARISLASCSRASPLSVFSLSWTMVTPPRRAASTCCASVCPRSQPVSVTAYKRQSCNFKPILNSNFFFPKNPAFPGDGLSDRWVRLRRHPCSTCPRRRPMTPRLCRASVMAAAIRVPPAVLMRKGTTKVKSAALGFPMTMEAIG